MKERTTSMKGSSPAAFLMSLMTLLMVAVLAPFAASAQGGVAMSGPFYDQVFEIPQGAEVSAPSIYITVFNEGKAESRFAVSYDAPAGVELLFSEDEFSLGPGEQTKVLITVKVGEEAVPGEYQLAVRAHQVVAQAEGQVAVIVAASQQADLVIVGDSAQVAIRALSPDGDPVVSQIRLFKVIGGRQVESALSETGVLEARVSPGSYVVSAYVDGTELVEENFDVAADETKQVDLTVRTVYISGFGVVPNYFTETGRLAHAEIVYTVNNLYQNMADVEIILKVNLDGQPLEEIALITFGSLNTGRTGGRYNYLPAKGWESGDYGFALELNAGGRLYTRALEQKLTVVVPSPVNYVQIGGGISALAIVAGAVYYAARKRKNRRGELA